MRRLCRIFLICSLLWPLAALAADLKTGQPASATVDIEADRLDVNTRDGTAVFRGNVKASRADIVVRGDTLALAGASLEVLHPDPARADAPNPNNRSVVCRLRWSGGSLLLTGDIEQPVEEALCGSDCRSDVLKVPHHGSDTSSTGPFLDAVAPRYAVISTGPWRGGDAVSRDVLERFRERGIEVLRTDRHGGVQIRLLENSFVVEAARLQRNYPVIAGTTPVARAFVSYTAARYAEPGRALR